MAGPKRIKGAALSLLIGTPPVDYRADTTTCVLDNEESSGGVTTFADAAAGGSRTYFLNITAIQSTDPTSLWSFVWDHAGEVVPFTYAPHGNETPTAAEPHFVGSVRIGPKPSIGGEAGATNEFTFETRWDVEGTPVKDTGE